MSERMRMNLFLLVSVFFNMAASFAHAVTPTLFNSLGLGQYMFGVALGSMLIVNFLFSPFWGRLNDFISSRYSLLICCSGYALGQFFFSQSTTEMHFIIARAFTGLFTAGTYVSMLTYIVSTMKDAKQRGSFLTISATIQTVGGAFGYFIGGMLGEISVNVTFTAQISTLLACGIAFFFICANDTKEESAVLKPIQIAKESNPFSAFLASRYFMTAVLATFFIMTALQSLGQVSFDQSSNYYLRDQLGLSSGYNGIIKGATGILTLIINSTLTIWLIRKTDIRKSIAGLFAASAAIMSVTVFSSTPMLFVASNVLFYAICAAIPPLLQNIMASLSDDKNSNLIMGFYNSMKSLGSIIGALLSGFLYAVGPKLPFVCGFIAYLLALLISLAYILTMRRKSSVDHLEA